MRYLLAIVIALCLCAPVYAHWLEDNFFLADVDLSGTTYYLGYKSDQSGWYIKALDTTNADQFRVTYSYVSGNTEYSHHWTNRASMSGASTFKVFDEAF